MAGNLAEYGLYVPSESAHLLPVFNAFRTIWPGKCTYYYQSDRHDKEREVYGWNDVHGPASVLLTDENRAVLETVPILHLTIRDVGLIERRLKRGLLTIYTSERWFKPVYFIRSFGLCDCSLSGIVRMLVPSYWRMARRFVRFFTNSKFYCLPFGVHAASDMARICGLLSGDLRCLFCAPKITFDHVPCGAVTSESSHRYRTDRMRLWGYFVSASGQTKKGSVGQSNVLKVLYVGRLLRLKRVDTIVRAMGDLTRVKKAAPLIEFELTIVGEGPDEKRLRRMAREMNQVTFLPFQNMHRVREMMREHDVLVFASDGEEGWGAVVSEGLEEGMKVLGSFESGASATMLRDEDIFPAGDWHVLAEKLLECARDKATGCLQGQGIGEWNPRLAARRLADWLKTVYDE